MSTDKKTLLQKVKAFFDAPLVAAPAAPVTPVGTASPFKLKDGTEISVMKIGATPAIADTVTVAGLPAPDADYILEDGTILTTVAGAITAITPPAPVSQTPEQLAAAAEAARVATPTVLTAEIVEAMYAKFATGTPEERLANIEVMIKALMECNFGYQIRQGQESQAIQVYKDSLANATATVAPQLATALAKIEKQDEVIKMQFELLEQIVETSSADPVTLTGIKKDRFDKLQKREDKFKLMADALKAAKEGKKVNPAAATV